MCLNCEKYLFTPNNVNTGYGFNQKQLPIMLEREEWENRM